MHYLLEWRIMTQAMHRHRRFSVFSANFENFLLALQNTKGSSIGTVNSLYQEVGVETLLNSQFKADEK